MLWLRWALMAKSCEGLFDVAGHAEMGIGFLVVPVKGQAELAGDLPVGVASVFLFEDFKEMCNVDLVDVLTPKSLTTRVKLMGRQEWVQ